MSKGISGFRSLLYGLGKLLGDISALSKGSNATAKRAGRRVAGKATGKVFRKIFK